MMVFMGENIFLRREKNPPKNVYFMRENLLWEFQWVWVQAVFRCVVQKILLKKLSKNRAPLNKIKNDNFEPKIYFFKFQRIWAPRA